MAGLVIGISEAITPTGLAYLTRPFGLVDFNDAGRWRAQDIAQNHLDLEALGRPSIPVANAAFINALFGKTG